MNDTTASDLFSPVMVVVWGLLAAAILLAIMWKVSKQRSRNRRREAARESKRQLHAWREGGAPPSAHHDAPKDSIPH